MGLIFTYTVFIYAVIIGVLKPYQGFLAYVLFGVIRPSSLWYWSVPASSFSWWIAISFLCGWALQSFGELKDTGRQTLYTVALFLLASVVTAAINPLTNNGFLYFINASKILLPCIAGISMVKTKKDVEWLGIILVLGIGIVALSLNQMYFEGNNRLKRGGFGGMDNNAFSIILASAAGFTGLASFACISPRKFLITLLVSGLCAHACIFSESRGAMLSIILVAVIALLFSRKSKRNVFVAVIAVTVTISTTGDLVRERFFSISRTSVFGAEQKQVEESAESRLHLWEICIRMWWDHPFVGVGPDLFSQYIQNYPIRLQDGTTLTYPRGKEAHNLWLQTLAEMGIVGFIPYALFFLLPLRRHAILSWKKRRNTDPIRLRNSMATVGGLTTFVFAASFVSVEGAEFAYYMVVFAVATEKIMPINHAEPTKIQSPS